MSEFVRKLVKLAEKKDWENDLDERAKRDREHIKIMQSTPEGSLAYNEAFKKLHRDYRGTIAQQASKSQLVNVMPSEIETHAAGMAMLKDIATRKFNLEEKIKPISYIQGNLFELMRKEKNNWVDFGSQKSADLTYKTGIMNNAVQLLRGELNREPTDKETHDFIKNVQGYKSITLGNIKKIKNQSRQEFSIDRVISAGDTGAEQLTWSDINNVEEGSAQDYRHEQVRKARIEKYLSQFDRKERTLLRRYYGLGQFSNSPSKNINAAASNSGMTNYAAQKIVNKLEAMIKRDFPEF